jgi:hypothetical protein
MRGVAEAANAGGIRRTMYARYMSEKGTGKFLGIPYDWRRPTAARLKSRWWNDDDERILTPRWYGWGYDLNVAQVLRRLRVRG